MRYARRYQTIIFGIGIAVLVAVIGIRIFHLIRIPAAPCVVKEITGIYCPGCGGTRAVKAFFEFRILRSILLHPLVMYVIGLFLWFMASYVAAFLSKGKICCLALRPIHGYIAVFLLLGNWVLKNFLLLAFGIPVLELL